PDGSGRRDPGDGQNAGVRTATGRVVAAAGRGVARPPAGTGPSAPGSIAELDRPARLSGRQTAAAGDRVDSEKESGMTASCTHLDQVRDVTPSACGCEDCLKTGDTWVHLRECLICGHVGCCDSSKNKHATKHFHATQHPIIRSFEPGENWRWCYIDEVFV